MQKQLIYLIPYLVLLKIILEVESTLTNISSLHLEITDKKNLAK